MRVESNRPYRLPGAPDEIKDNIPERSAKLPSSTVNLQGDQYELSAEQRVTQNLLSNVGKEKLDAPLPPERLAAIHARLKSGHYLSDEAAELTSTALLSFHK